MSSVKPNIELEQVLLLLQEHFGKPVSQFTPIVAGLIARTFSFCVDNRDYVIRFQTDNMLAHFEKEKYICENYGSPHIPIPSIVHIGRFQDLHFAISHKVLGQTLDKLSAQEYQQALPSVVETLYAIHQVNVSHKPMYGLFDGQGIGVSASWRGFLSIIREEEAEWDFYGKWHVLFETSILERDTFDFVYDHMVRLLNYCSEECHLVHGGYGFGNVLVHEGKVAGVVDWMDAKFGDYVYDIAWLDFWSSSNYYQQLCYKYYTSHGFSIPFFEERLLCYKCYMSLDGLRFFAKVRNEGAYQWVRGRILDLLS